MINDIAVLKLNLKKLFQAMVILADKRKLIRRVSKLSQKHLLEYWT